MDVATPTEDCLTLVYDLLADVKETSTNLLSHQEVCDFIVLSLDF